MIGNRWPLRPWVGWKVLIGEVAQPVAAVLIVVVGILVWRRDPAASAELWLAGGVLAVLAAGWRSLGEVRRHRVGTDLPALLAAGTAVYLGEYLVAAVIGAAAAMAAMVRAIGMYQARQDLRRLMAGAARWAHRRELGSAFGGVRTVPSDVVEPGDLLVVPCGATVAVDCRLAESGYFDESALGGRIAPVLRAAGEPVGSGAVNVGPATEMWATRRAADSAQQRLVRAARRATVDGAALVRRTNRLAPGFLAAVALLAGTTWLVSGQPLRVLAVLAAAALAPLTVAARIALTAGMSRAARRGALVPDGTDFERLARIPAVRPVLVRSGAGDPDGTTAAAEVPAPDGVLVVDPRQVALAAVVAAARRARRIATQSVLLGLVLTGAAMAGAALGRLDPVSAVGMQCLTEVAVVLCALRALLPPWWGGGTRRGADNSSGGDLRPGLAHSS
jgi:cation transport ATPase